MSRETEDHDILPEYDFSGGERGKYTSRFEERSEAFLESATELDRQAWIAHSLRRVQDFESYLVAYWALALHHDPTSAGKAVSALLHSCDNRPLKLLQRDLTEFTSVSEDFYRELLQLIEDRNWLVHKSFQSFSSSRVHSIAERSTHLTEVFSTLLLERCRKEGLNEAEVKNKTHEVIKEWAADKNAA